MSEENNDRAIKPLPVRTDDGRLPLERVFLGTTLEAIDFLRKIWPKANPDNTYNESARLMHEVGYGDKFTDKEGLRVLSMILDEDKDHRYAAQHLNSLLDDRLGVVDLGETYLMVMPSCWQGGVGRNERGSVQLFRAHDDVRVFFDTIVKMRRAYEHAKAEKINNLQDILWEAGFADRLWEHTNVIDEGIKTVGPGCVQLSYMLFELLLNPDGITAEHAMHKAAKAASI